MQKAFDLIVERLEESKKASYEKYKDAIDGIDIFHYGSITNAYGNAIEIVNQVAEEYKQEVCEWKENAPYSTPNKTSCGNWVVFIGCAYKYCPYCGKKIKVIE